MEKKRAELWRPKTRGVRTLPDLASSSQPPPLRSFLSSIGHLIGPSNNRSRSKPSDFFTEALGDLPSPVTNEIVDNDVGAILRLHEPTIQHLETMDQTTKEYLN